MALQSYQRPYDNWDEIGYVGSAISWSVKSPVEAHRLTFQFLREATSSSSFDENTSGPYRSDVYHNPSTFALQLPIYKIKPIYVLLVWLSWKLGYNPVRASSAISAIAAGCLGLIVATILIGDIGPIIGVIIYPAIIVFGGAWASAKFSTPDALSALTVFGGMWLLRRSYVSSSEIGLLLLCAAIGIRPDNVILLLSCVAVLTFAALWDRSVELQVPIMALLAILGIAVWFVSGKLAGDYGWKVIIHHSLVRLVTSNRDLTTFRWSDYGYALENGAKWLIGSSPYFGIARTGFSPQLPLVVAVAYLLTYCQEQKRDSMLLMAVLLYMITHFVLYPSGEERFFYGVDTFIFVLGAKSLYEFQKRSANV